MSIWWRKNFCACEKKVQKAKQSDCIIEAEGNIIGASLVSVRIEPGNFLGYLGRMLIVMKASFFHLA